jgi:hypothetical protein
MTTRIRVKQLVFDLPIEGIDGSLASPAFSFSSDSGTGTYLRGPGQIGLAGAGTDLGSFDALRWIAAPSILELSRGGNVLKNAGTVIQARDNADADFVILEARTPTPGDSINALATREYITNYGGISAAQHKSLRDIIHFIDEGPGDGFPSGTYKEILGGLYPTSVTWYDSSAPGKKKILEKIYTWTGATASPIVWNIYDAAEVLLLALTDTITYSGILEISRIRTYL